MVIGACILRLQRACGSSDRLPTHIFSPDCRYPYKDYAHSSRSNTRLQAESAFEKASNYKELGSLLTTANHCNGTLVHCFLEWWRSFEEKHPGLITVFGAPYEAEAQCAEFERCGFVDAVLSVDSDMVVHGVKHFIKGFNKAGSSGVVEAYVKSKHPLFKAMSDQQRVAFAVFCGYDYDPGLKGVGWKKGQELAAGWVAAEAVLQLTATSIF